MGLTEVQKKFILSKPSEFTIIKGKSNTGKTEALLHRVLNLVNNFSYEYGDKILFVSKSEGSIKNIRKRYQKVKDKNDYMYLSLLTSKTEPEFCSLSEVTQRHGNYKSSILNKEKIKIIKKILEDNGFKGHKKLNENNIAQIIQEIKFMKNKGVSIGEEFNTLIGDPLRIRKKSKMRKDMFLIYNEYNNILKEENTIDEEDLYRELIKEVDINEGYTHIFIENAENLSKMELEFLLALHKRKSYGTVTIGIDTDKGENIFSELVKNGKVHAKKVFGKNKKVFNFKEEAQSNKKIEVIQEKEELFTFIDLKHRKNFTFSSSAEHESLKDGDNINYSKNELEEIPVFSNIAAGEPILINDKLEDTFILPKLWVRSSNSKFILRVKGDSMINANINDGDFVLIEQNPAPLNGDIVAVNIEGSATLKRIKAEEERILLLPENEKYDPIIINREDEFYILGKAIGIISSKERQ